jgi:hypothetical protein
MPKRIGDCVDYESAFAKNKAKLDQDDKWIELEPNDEFTIIVTDFEERTSKYGANYAVVRGTDEHGEEIVFGATRKVAREKFLENRPEIGDVVSVRYLGQVQPEKGGNPYHNYRIAITHMNATPPKLEPTNLERAADTTADALEKDIPTESFGFEDEGASV